MIAGMIRIEPCLFFCSMPINRDYYGACAMSGSGSAHLWHASNIVAKFLYNIFQIILDNISCGRV